MARTGSSNNTKTQEYRIEGSWVQNFSFVYVCVCVCARGHVEVRYGDRTTFYSETGTYTDRQGTEVQKENFDNLDPETPSRRATDGQGRVSCVVSVVSPYRGPYNPSGPGRRSRKKVTSGRPTRSRGSSLDTTIKHFTVVPPRVSGSRTQGCPRPGHRSPGPGTALRSEVSLRPQRSLGHKRPCRLRGSVGQSLPPPGTSKDRSPDTTSIQKRLCQPDAPGFESP